MFAIVRTGGKQYRVAAGDKIAVEKIAGDAGDSISLGDVLLAGEGSELKAAKDLTVSAEIIAQGKTEKVIIFKKRRRHNYRRKNGHRQQMTILKITAIGNEKPKAAAKKADEPKPVEAAAPVADTTAVAAAPKADKPAAEKKPAAAKKPAAKQTDA